MNVRPLSFVLALTLTACALGPDYLRPPLDVPETFRWQHGEPEPGSFGDLGWWQVYQDAELQRLIATALTQNFDVRIAASRIEQARATLGVARLGQLPQISGTGGISRAELSASSGVSTISGTGGTGTGGGGSTGGGTTGTSVSGFDRYRTTANLQLGTTWELDLWGRLRRLTEAARADLLATQYAQQGVIVSLVGDVATSYFNLLSLDQQLQITRRTVATRQKFVELTRARHDSGVVSGLDVATAEAQLANANANIPELERQISLAEDQLSILLGQNPGLITRGTVDAVTQAPVPPAGLPSSLLERRPDLRQAESSLVSANARIGAAKAALFPTISLTAAGGTATTDLSQLFNGPAGLWSIGANLVLPLLDANRSLYQVDLANARTREAILNYQKSLQGAFRDVADALIARQKYAEFEQTQAAQVEALRRADDIALARYRIGFSSYFDVINAERDLFGAELTLAAARRNTLVSAVQLYRALGGGWQTPPPSAADSAATLQPVSIP